MQWVGPPAITEYFEVFPFSISWFIVDNNDCEKGVIVQCGLDFSLIQGERFVPPCSRVSKLSMMVNLLVAPSSPSVLCFKDTSIKTSRSDSTCKNWGWLLSVAIELREQGESGKSTDSEVNTCTVLLMIANGLTFWQQQLLLIKSEYDPSYFQSMSQLGNGTCGPEKIGPS